MDDVVFMVRAKTLASCREQLARLCERMDARVLTNPIDAAGGRWVARAVPRPAPADADDDRESAAPSG